MYGIMTGLFFDLSFTDVSNGMGQHQQEESEGRQAKERGGLIITVSHNVPNNISKMLKLKKLTGVRKSFRELNFKS